MNKIAIVLMIAVISLISACGTDGSGTDHPAPGSYVELDPDSRLAQENLEILSDYLADKRPDISEMILVSSHSQVVAGTNVVLVCSYVSAEDEFFLRALLYTDPEGDTRVEKVVFQYEYNRE